jgi:hypothetical protein
LRKEDFCGDLKSLGMKMCCFLVTKVGDHSLGSRSNCFGKIFCEINFCHYYQQLERRICIARTNFKAAMQILHTCAAYRGIAVFASNGQIIISWFKAVAILLLPATAAVNCSPLEGLFIVPSN